MPPPPPTPRPRSPARDGARPAQPPGARDPRSSGTPSARPRRAPAWLPCLAALAGLAPLATEAATPDLTRLPTASAREVSFSADIQPLLESACLRCHGAERPKSGFRLDHAAGALQGGNLGVAIVPGDSARSPLIHYVARLVPGLEMPPEGKGEPLTADQVGLLRAWVDQGAPWSGADPGPQISFSITPAVQFISIDGNAARFREHQWMREGWGGGASEFSLKYDADPRTRVGMDGRALAGPDDYRFRVRAERDEVGWAEIEYREFSRFQDDTGGYYAPFGMAAPRLGDDLVLRHQHATVEVGLELPDWPQLRLAYDLHRRDGTEATLHWGALTQDDVQRNIYPGRKRIDETTHRLTLDLAYDWNGLLLSDQAQFEWHAQDNRRINHELATPPLDWTSRVTDRQDSWRGANVLRLERALRDWLSFSGGYLFSQLEDHGAFSVEGFSPSDPTLPPSLDLSTDDLSLRRRSHVLNANALLGPWEQLHFYAGLQADWTRQEGFARGRAYFQPTVYDANLDRAATDENLGLRYAGIPWTVLFAETRFQQETYDHFEEGLASDARDFLRDTDARGDLWDVEAGFTVSPWRTVSLQAKYRHRDRENHYDHAEALDVLSSTSGYPAFIRDRDTVGDEVETRLVVQPLRWLKATLKYTIAATDYRTATAAWEGFDDQGNPFRRDAGELLAGEYDAQNVTGGFVFTPWARLHLATTVGWTTSRTRSGVDNGQEVVPYEGDTWNLLTAATYLLDEKTDLLATYLFSTADFRQDNAASGLPLGIEYTRHAATFGLNRRLRRERTLRLEYAYFTYDEPTLGGAADYTAHGLFASFRIPWK